MRHTPGPWHVYERNNVIYTRDKDGKSTSHARVYAGDQKANAWRIVACVNACEGIQNEQLENFTGAVFKHSQVELWRGYCELKEQRAELLAALKEVRADVARVESGKFCDLRVVLRELDEAITKGET